MLPARFGLVQATTANHAALIPTVHAGVFHPGDRVAANADTSTMATASPACSGQ
jgi:hypothetical protein